MSEIESVDENRALLSPPSLRRPFPISRRIATVTLFLYRHMDLTAFRVFFAASSYWLAITIFRHQVMFKANEPFSEMLKIAPPLVWSLAIFLHGVLLSWRLIDTRPRVCWALAINVYGFLVWFLYVVLQDYAMGYDTINNSCETVVILMAFFTIPATGTRREVITP